MRAKELLLKRERIFGLSIEMRRIAGRLAAEDATRIREAADAIVDLWEDRRFAREQFCLLESLEASGRKVVTSPEEVAESMGWPVKEPGRFFPELHFSKEDGR